MSVVMVHAIPDDVLIGERERLLAMVDILETVPLEEMRKLARRPAFTRLNRGRLADLARKEVPERLASQILRLVESEGVVTPEGYRIDTRYTHRQLATMIGANRETVTRAFGKLRSEGA